MVGGFARRIDGGRLMSRNNREKIAAAFRPCKFESRPKAAAPAKTKGWSDSPCPSWSRWRSVLTSSQEFSNSASALLLGAST
jgi:hypothetical protein